MEGPGQVTLTSCFWVKKDRIVAIFDELSGLEKRYSDADGEFESIRFAILGKK